MNGCCDDIPLLTEVWHRAGLSSLPKRAGDHAAFLSAMLARLSAADFPALRDLRVRTPEDPAIALLDAAAAMADIVTFNAMLARSEHFLRTAGERRSLVALARFLGQEPSPGLAATAYLAWTLEDGPGAPEAVVIPAGTRVASTPPPGAAPAIFETLTEIEARPEWGAMRPLPARPHPVLSATTDRLRVKGIRADIRPGEDIALVWGTAVADRAARRVAAIRTDPARQETEIDLAPLPAPIPIFALPLLAAATFTLAPLPMTNVTTGPAVLQLSWKGNDLAAFAGIQRWPLVSLRLNLQAQRDERREPPGTGAFRFTRSAGAFGRDAPRWASLPPAQRLGERVRNAQGTEVSVAAPYPTDWDATGSNTLNADATQAGISGGMHLDSTVPEALPGSWTLLRGNGRTLVANVTASEEVERAAFTLSARVTRLNLDTTNGFNEMRRRAVSVALGSERLELAPIPIPEPVAGNSLVLDAAYLGLREGQAIAVSGPREDLSGVAGSEVATIAAVEVVDGLSVLTLMRALRHRYRRADCRVNANLTLASHGEARTEVLGSGDGRTPFAAFRIGAAPVTQLPAATSAGRASTLTVHVSGETWAEVPTLVGRGPADRVYIATTGEDGATTLRFGDGVTGARLPSGIGNVVAAFRVGLGEAGLVPENTLNLPVTRPAGVRAVTNPEAAADAAERDGPEAIRLAAPLGVRTLGRTVSLQDHEDMALAFPNIAKALARWSWNGRARGVFLTVAGARNTVVDPSGTLGKALAGALRAAGDGRVPIRIAAHRSAFFRIEGKLRRDRGRDRAAVDAAVEAALRTHFRFAARRFGQEVAASEVIGVIQAVPGVLAFDLDLLVRSDGTPAADGLLPAAMPQAGVAAALPAELLLLDPRPLAFGDLA